MNEEITLPHEFIFVLISYFIEAILSKKYCQKRGGGGGGGRLKKGRPYMWFSHRKQVKPSAHHVTKI